MTSAKIFMSGNSQAVRLPKEFRFKGDEVDIFRQGGDVILREKSHGLERAFELIANLPLDEEALEAIENIRKEQPQSRDDL